MVINKVTGVTDGNTMILSVGHSGATNPSVTGSWRLLHSAQYIWTWYRIANSEPASYTISWTGSVGSIGASITEWSGCDASDPIMGFRGTSVGGDNTPHPHNGSVLFQSCSYTAVSALGHISSPGPTISGWTSAVVSGGSPGSRQSHKRFTSTANWTPTGNDWTDSGGGHNYGTTIVILRDAGETALSLKSWSLTRGADNQTSISVALPPAVVAGNLIVVNHAVRNTTNATARTLSASGYTAYGNQLSMAVGSTIQCSRIYSRVATGSDALNCAVSLSTTFAWGMVAVFSTGSGGLTPSLIGTMGETNDSSVNTTQTVAAMVLSDYAETNILLKTALINVNTPLTAGGGFGTILETGGTSAGMVEMATKSNSGADPAATSWTTGANASANTFQLAVGFQLDGAGFYTFGQIIAPARP